MLTAWLVCCLALVLDRLLGEPRRWHPLVGFGRLAGALETRMNHGRRRIMRGAIAVVLLVLPLLMLGLLVRSLPWLPQLVLEVLILWLALSLRGLTEHARAVIAPLQAGDLDWAQAMVGRIVSRRADQLDATGVATAATESVLENGADAVFASLFWYLLAGPAGVLVHRAVNTLDAMWGYRNERFLRFGRVAARLDDLLNWIPARLTALTYALLGRTQLALQCWRRQAPGWDSPNAGPVMAAGAGALGVQLGGVAPYRDGIHDRPLLGAGPQADAGSIVAALALVRHGAGLWMVIVGAVALMLAFSL
ncbi:MAG: adenosylcobinamide-phosphate synthase CbiB [Marinobacter sp.]|nr:adenosylcobinamide-phosphate synthase CbiB [Marinobacter sp.]